MSLPDFLTMAEIDLALSMWNFSRQSYARRVCDQIIRPNLERISTPL